MFVLHLLPSVVPFTAQYREEVEPHHCKGKTGVSRLRTWEAATSQSPLVETGRYWLSLY